MKEICKIDGCNSESRTIGLCNAHHLKFVRHGDPLYGRTINAIRQEKKDFIDFLKSENTENCIKWPFSTNKHGYGTISINGRQTSAHRYVCELFYGKPPNSDYQAAHFCGKGKEGCVNPKHIRWATKRENESDKINHGTSNRGENNGHHKLTEEQVAIIYKSTDKNNKDLAITFNISVRAVRDIKNKQRWKWLTDSIDTANRL